MTSASAGSSRQPHPQRRRQGVGQPAGLGQRHRERAAAAGHAVAGGGTGQARVEAGVEPAPDQRGEALALGRADPAGVPRGQQQVVAVGDGLPQRHRQQDVGGERLGVGRLQGRLVQPVQLGAALVAPRPERLEVVQRILRRERRAEAARCARRGGGRGRRGHRRGHERP